MEIPITVEQAMAEYPSQVEEILSKLRKGKSKNKNAEPQEMQWNILWAETIPASDIDIIDIINGIRQETEKTEDLETKIERRIKNSDAYIVGKTGRWVGSSSLLKTLPQEIPKTIRELEDKNMKELQRIAALTPEEQNAELTEAFSQLFGKPGFMMFRL